MATNRLSGEQILAQKREERAAARIEQHNDGWNGLLSGLGGQKDKSQNLRFQAPLVTDKDVNDMLRTEGILNSIIEITIQQIMGIDFEFVGDTNGAFYDLMRELRLKDELKKVLYDYFTGGKAFLFFDPGMKIIRHLTPEQISPNTDSLDKDLYSPTFGEYKEYKLNSLSDTQPISGSNVLHWETKGDSLAKKCVQPIISLLVGYQIITHLQQESVVGRFTIPELGKMLLDDAGINAVMMRLKAADRGKGVINSILLGREEQFTRDQVTFQNWDAIILKQQEHIAAVCRIPISNIFSINQSGLNASGRGDVENFQDYILTTWQTLLDSKILKLAKAFNKSITDVAPQYEWMDRIEIKVKSRKVQAEIDKMYFDMGVVSGRELEENRFTHGYSFETVLKRPAAEPKKKTLDERRGEFQNVGGRPAGR
jgi:phage-related protein (TIGR01555 family)